MATRPSPAPAPPRQQTPQATPAPTPDNLDSSVNCPYYDTRPKIMFGNPERYAKACPHSWEAEQFKAGKYDLKSFAPATLHPDYNSKHLPTYTQVAGTERPPRPTRGKKATPQGVAVTAPQGDGGNR